MSKGRGSFKGQVRVQLEGECQREGGVSKGRVSFKGQVRVKLKGENQREEECPRAEEVPKGRGAMN